MCGRVRLSTEVRNGSNDESERLLVRPLVASPIEHALKRVIRAACRERE
jgi:hypothetical protein